MVSTDLSCEDNITDRNDGHSSADTNAEHSSTDTNGKHGSTVVVLAFANAIIDREPPDKKQTEMMLHHKATLYIEVSYEQTGSVAISQFKYN